MNVLCIGDPHFQESNINDAEKIIQVLVDYVQKIKPTFVVILGDTLHTNETIKMMPFKKATEMIEKVSKHTDVYLLIGNHDFFNESQYLTDNHPFFVHKYIKNVFVIDKPTMRKYSNLTFCFMPYVQKGMFTKTLNNCVPDWLDSDCIFAHQEFKGCKMGAFISEGEEWSSDNPLVVCGHIHEHQILEPNIFYTGSAMQHGDADNQRKHIYHFIFEKENDDLVYTFNRLNNGILPKKKIVVKYEDIHDLDIDKYSNTKLIIDVVGLAEQLKSFKTSKLYKVLSEKAKINTKVSVVKVKKSIQLSNKTYVDILKELCNDNGLLNLLKEIINDHN